jgi:hypothetical protein
MKRIIILSSVIAAFACNSNNTEANKNGTTKEVAQNVTNSVTATTSTTTNAAQTTIEYGKDTLLINESCLVAHFATNAETKKLEKEGGENFGEALSDNLFYMDEAMANAKKLNIKVIKTEAKCIAFKSAKGEPIFKVRGKDFSSWGLIGFNGTDQPIKIEMVMSENGLKKVFKK